ncbi:hypothetical protein ACLKA7_001029 [Drosophila subpalustris]
MEDTAMKHDKAADNINSERAKWKKRFDNKHSNPVLYSIGDLVVVENEPAATGESRKLEPLYRGPYQVTKTLGNDRYVIEDIPGMQITTRKYCSVYSSDKMKPWCSGVPELDAESDDDNRIEADSKSGLAELSSDNI